MPDGIIAPPQRRATLEWALKAIAWLTTPAVVAVFFDVQWQEAQEQAKQASSDESAPAPTGFARED